MAWEKRESRLIVQCLSERFGNLSDLGVASANMTTPTVNVLRNQLQQRPETVRKEEEDS